MAIVGTEGADNLQDNGSPDIIQGLGGNDTLTSIRDDTLQGGAGDDLLQANSPFSTYNGWASYEQASGPVHVSLTATGPQDVGADQGTDTLVKLGGLIGSTYGDTLTAGPNDTATEFFIYGGNGGDSIVSGSGNDQLYGDAGNDTIDASHAGSGSWASGGDGNDVIYESPSSGAAAGGDGDDQIFNAHGAHGGDGQDTLTGAHAQGATVGVALYGDGGDDSLVGTDLHDELYGGAGSNTIDGGGGGDFVHVFDQGEVSPGYRSDVVHETGANNFLWFQDAPNNAQTAVDLGAGTGHVDLVSASGAQRVADLTFDHINGVMGSNGDDSIVGSAGADTLVGLDGTNTLFGGDVNDSIDGGSGHNQINGNKGDDTIVGESGIGDWLLGGQGNDSIVAQSGSNIINGNLGNDTLFSGSMDGQTLRGGQGDDSITGGGYGGSYSERGGDLIFGDLGHNTLRGGAGPDTFHAGAGHDVVTDFSVNDSDHVLVDPGVTWQASQSGSDVLITFSNGGDMLLQNIQLSSLPSGWIGTA